MNDRDPNRPLRIGYVSADFRQHALCSFFLPLSANHNRQMFRIHCYSNVRAPDAVTALIRGRSDVWRDIVGIGDHQAAELIRKDGVDILVDLSGHTAQSRLLMMALKPAPIQMTYLGYPGTTGLPAIDYRLTDSLADPPGMTESHHSEKLLRLPRTNWCFQPIVDGGPVGPSPCASTGFITFGSFSNFAKINRSTLGWWAKVLAAVPRSRLVLKAKALSMQSVREELRNHFASFGVTSDRLDLRGRVLNPAEHLASYGQIDIALDTFPYHGTTTTCESLWMGVPVVTLAGQAHVARVGVSLLTNIGLAELVAQTPDQYISIAVRLASDPINLANLRAQMRQRMQNSPLMDAKSFAADVEAAYRLAWQAWCEKDQSLQPQNAHGACAVSSSLS